MTDWRKLFAATPRQTLSFYPPNTVNGSILVSPPKETFARGAEEWKHSVIAQFLGQPPSLNLLNRVLPKLWEKKGTISINQAGKNLYIFQFDSENIRNWVIDNGPWHVHHNMMVLRKWEPNTGGMNFDLCKLPVWFHLHHIPLELYTGEGISYLASAIGNPLYMDTVTASKKRLEYAKVCIEVSANVDPPEYIDVMLEDGSITSVGVSIPWKPVVCKPCNTFGHSELACVKKNKKIWIEKTKASNAHDVTVNMTEKLQQVEASTVAADTTHEVAVNITEKPGQVEAITVAADTAHEVATADAPTSEITVALDTPQTASGSKNKKPVLNKPLTTWSPNVKHSITGSSNKYAALLEESAAMEEEEDQEIIDVQRVDNDEEIWQKLIDNASFSPRKTRIAAQGAAQVLINMKEQFPKETKPVRKVRSGNPSRGRKS